MSFESLNYDGLESISNKFYGFLVIPYVLSFIKIHYIIRNKNFNRFQSEFFSLLLKQSILRFNIILTVIALTLFLVSFNLLMLSVILGITSIITSISIVFSLKSNVSYLQSIENLAYQKNKLIIE